MVLPLTLTKHDEDRKDEYKVEFEEHFASKSAGFIGERSMWSVRELGDTFCRLSGGRVMTTVVPCRKVRLCGFKRILVHRGVLSGVRVDRQQEDRSARWTSIRGFALLSISFPLLKARASHSGTTRAAKRICRRVDGYVVRKAISSNRMSRCFDDRVLIQHVASNCISGDPLFVKVLEWCVKIRRKCRAHDRSTFFRLSTIFQFNDLRTQGGLGSCDAISITQIPR